MTAFLGMGLLGSNFVRAMLARGETVRVWNRSPDKAQVLVREGALAFDHPAETVRGAERIHLTLSDDAAVDEVLDQASPGFGKHVTIIDHTTTSTQGALRRVQRFGERGHTYLHAPVFMGPQNARESTGLMLVSGDESVVARVRSALEPMTGTVWYVGPRTDAAAAFKLMGNLFLMFVNTGLADLLALAKSTHIAPGEAIALLQKFNPGAQATTRMQRMIDAKFGEPSWELGMARKDARLMLEEAERAGVALNVLPAIAARMDQVIAEGHAHSDWSVLAKDAVS